MKLSTITLKKSHQALQTIFDDWYGDAPSVSGKIVDSIDYAGHQEDSWDSKQWGTFETLGTDFENKKVVIKELPEMIGKSLWEVGDYIKSKSWTPVGHEYVQWLYEHQDAQENPKDYQWWYCFGSLFRYSVGAWLVPCVVGDASGFDRLGNPLGAGWLSNCRVVLLETTALDLDPLKSLNPDSLASLALRVEKLEETVKKLLAVVNIK